MLTGGGTGGHIYPALALAHAFAGVAEFAPLDVLFVGTRDRMEATIVPEAGLPIRFVQAAPLARSVSPALLIGLLRNAAGIVQSARILLRARPDVVIATGGYVAFPVVAALRVLRLLRRTRARVAVFEANAAAGLANRILAPMVDEVWLAMAPEKRPLTARETLVGMPVRASMRRSFDVLEARGALGLDALATTIVVMGGSLGARSLNEAAAGLVEAGLPQGWQLLVVAGARDYEDLRRRLASYPRVTVRSYLNDPRAAYAAADVLVARAGASTLGELAATATPALLVPYPHATDDHQTANALAFTAGGGARMLGDAELGAARLRAELEAMLAPGVLGEMRAAAGRGAQLDPAAAVTARVKRWSRANVADP
ncbi:MAG: UDP-N-acetylglucosamine--N-acetylmuramyl-(pentapeptide) pyrophosphoryl-undecaprenol N-acetylglucosamine transferase [Candidatus Eremiobacteraeota bacterium]|nr:UDP-N-acetylglucosamine--N-acetylmuramyl-(pentapeptide) pyrophosphoryl-undecaprenol N-acetylglucosamine transferase [Candidatus Eremiobacteraeota bacterium]